jgi:prevent-host-death family protein
MTTLKSSDARTEWAEMLNRVGYGGERITIERRGRPVAVLVSPEDAELLEAIEDRIDAREARKVLESDEEPVPIDEALDELDG